MPDSPDDMDPTALALALARLRAAGEHDAADALLAHAAEPVEKAMSGLVGSAGGFLVPPAAGVRKKRRKRLRACIRKALDRLGE